MPHPATRATLALSLAFAGGAAVASAQHVRTRSDTAAVRKVVEALASFSQAKNLAGLDTLYAPDAWVRVIEGAGVNNGWGDYRDHHLAPELAEFQNFTYRYFDVEPQVRGDVAWAAFRYELVAGTPSGHAEAELPRG